MEAAAKMHSFCESSFSIKMNTFDYDDNTFYIHDYNQAENEKTHADPLLQCQKDAFFNALYTF